MPEAPPDLVVYPRLWRQSLLQHPSDWRAQFHCLCRLVRDYRRQHRAAVKRCGEGERLFLQSLDQCDTDDIIRTIETEWAKGSAHPLWALDPDYQPPIVTTNGHKVLDA
jgi:hypothetical protein